VYWLFLQKTNLSSNTLVKLQWGLHQQLPLNKMSGNMVELTCEYCAAEYEFYIETEDGVEVEGTLDNAWIRV
jgi:two-component system NtrC family sensor kinase